MEKVFTIKTLLKVFMMIMCLEGLLFLKQQGSCANMGTRLM